MAASLVLIAGCGGDDAADEPAVSVSGAWARPSAPGAADGAVYLDLEAATDDALVTAAVDPSVAAAVELHETVTSAAGLTSMRQMPALPLPAGEAVSIESGTSHVMLVDLAAPLVDGDTFDLTLDFEFAPDVTVTVTVDASR